MTRQLNTIALAAAFSLSFAALAPVATTAIAQQNTQQMYGSQLMTQQERLEHRQRLQNAKTEQDRAQIRAEHRKRMQDRAKQKGVALPDDAPTEDMRRGAGRGQGGGGRIGK